VTTPGAKAPGVYKTTPYEDQGWLQPPLMLLSVAAITSNAIRNGRGHPYWAHLVYIYIVGEKKGPITIEAL
jgi:hypothetical protein